MGKRIGGKDVDIMLGDMMVHVDSFSCTISDGTAVSKTRGVPNGWIDGETSAEGDIEVDTNNFNLIIEVGKRSGSFKGLPPFDIVTNAETTDDRFKLEIFGCKLMAADLIAVDAKGGETLKHKLKYIVTSPDFIRMNGLPYLEASETKSLR